MSFKLNLINIFGIIFIISYFNDINVHCDEDIKESQVAKIIDDCGRWDEISAAPWIVTIFRQETYKTYFYRHLCDGSMVMPNVILTAAQCFTDLIGSVSSEPDKTYVIAGKHNTNFEEDEFAETNPIQVKEIHITPGYKALHTKFKGNLAVVVLQKPFQISITVQPVCFDRNNKIELQDLIHYNNETVSWSTDQYQYIEVNATDKIDLNKCFKKIPNNFLYNLNAEGICPAVTSEPAVCWNIGGGIILKNNEQFYIRGIIGFTPTVKRHGCEPDLHYGVFTNISEYHEFILQILDDHEIKIGDCPDLKAIHHGKIEFLGQKQSYKLGTPVRNYALIMIICDTNYALRPTNSLLTCFDGNYTTPIPQCKRILKAAVDDVINVIDECGYWDENPPAPWNVAVYHKQGNKYIFRCGGSIITANVIITAASCITDNEDYETKLPAEEFYVAAGKYYNDYNAEEDEFAQKSQVKEYHIPPEFEVMSSDNKGDLAVVVLKNQFHMTNVVQPVCLDRNNKIEARQVTPDNKGIVVGWHRIYSYFHEELKQANSTYIDNEQCLNTIGSWFHNQLTSDKFCASYISCGNHGAGLAYKWVSNNKQQFYIRGVNSFVDTRGTCSDEFYTGIFINITSYKKFILNIIDQQLRTDSCPSITIENGQFVVLGEDNTPGDVISNYKLIQLSCNANYKLHPENHLIACRDGNWNVPIPECKLTCLPIISSSVDVTCLVDGNPVDCSQPLVDGAVIRSRCKSFYRQALYDDIPVLKCVKGSLSKPLIACVPECGEVISNGVTNVVNGTSTKKGEFPWHIALYRLQKGNHVYKCGGSIINPLIIITAAHCFTDENATKYPADEFYVGAGKYYSEYNSAEDIFAQKRHVKEYHIPTGYTGYETNFAGDLAVIVVEKAFVMTNVVQPVCMDWHGSMENQQLTPNNVGSVVGWGYVIPNISKVSAELRRLNPPVIDQQQCINEVPSHFRRWVTMDKFCAGFRTGASICKGDSGGGLVFKSNNNREQYFLRGVVSVGPLRQGVCDDFHYGVYTKISTYNNFIQNIIAANH